MATGWAGASTNVMVLPEASHDEGFAMKSGFSTKLLTGLALFDAKCAIGTRHEGAFYVGAAPVTFAARKTAPICVAAARLRGVIRSLDLGLNVDKPCSGLTTYGHVFSGVKLYQVTS